MGDDKAAGRQADIAHPQTVDFICNVWPNRSQPGLLFSESLSVIRGSGELNSSAFITLQPEPRGESGKKRVGLDESTTFQHRWDSGWLFVHVASPTNLICSAVGAVWSLQRFATVCSAESSRLISSDA